ncbi:MAG: hypothetical protein RL477_2302 [Pseudomonadota bacterium]|jgi:tripartite-type tricarboxylate transporter receptor subunit TctC
MTARCRAVFFVLALGALLAAAPAGAPRAQDWRPEKITVLLGHAPGGSFDRATRELANGWSVRLGAPVVVVARGRAGMMRAAGEFVLAPRDGRVVLAGDLGALALAYARSRPTWNWAQTFEHIGVFAVDPVVLFTGTGSGLDDLGDVKSQARGQPYPIVVAAWDSLENMVLQDIGRAAGLRFAVTPAGGGPGLAGAVTRGVVRLGFGRLSLLREARRSIRVLAHARALGRDVAGGSATLEAAFGVTSPPVGAFAAITVHAGFQRDFPERYERLKRALDAARQEPDYIESLEELGLTVEGAEQATHQDMLAAVRDWWDASTRVASVLAVLPQPARTRGKIQRVEEDGRQLRYLGLDGKTHDLSVDPEDTEVTVAGALPAGSDILRALRPGMICEITRPSALAVQASALACK